MPPGVPTSLAAMRSASHAVVTSRSGCAYSSIFGSLAAVVMPAIIPAITPRYAAGEEWGPPSG